MPTRLNLGQISGLTESLENLNEEINNEESRIDNILSGTTSDLDSFAEIISFIQDIDAENDTELSLAILNSSLNSGDTYVVGGIFDSSSGTITFTNNLGSSFVVTGITSTGGGTETFQYVKENSISFLEANSGLGLRSFLPNEILFHPIYIKQSLDITHAQLQVNSTAGSTSKVIVGLYDSVNGLPSTLLDNVIINTTSNAIFSTAFSSPISVNPGIYWVATTTNLSLGCYCLRTSTIASSVVGLSTTLINVVSNSNGGGLSNFERYRLSYTYDGTLPTTITNTLTITDSTYASPFITFLINY
jgi:hypothetical protein